MEQLEVTDVTIESGTRLRVQFDCTSGLERCFAATEFIAEYDVNIEDVPEGLLVVPALANLCPIVWANEADLYIHELDEMFAAALQELRGELQETYPELALDGTIYADNLVSPATVGGSRRMMLFSGGIDSTATYIRHEHEDPILVSIHGADVSEENTDGWETLSANLRDFARRTDSQFAPIRSNLRSMLDRDQLNSHYGDSITANWWAGVQHGIAIPTLCAPIANVMDVGQIYIASSHSKEFSEPWGSQPSIDNKVRWTGTITSHDGYELSRQDKVGIIAEHIQTQDPKLQIRSCYTSNAGDNCSECEKCSRTIVGLEAVGVDAGQHGYDVNQNTFSSIRQKLTEGLWKLGDNEQYMWEDIQGHIDLNRDIPHTEGKAFLRWLSNADIEEIKKWSSGRVTPRDRVKSYLQRLPDPVYKLIVLSKRTVARG